MAGAPSARGLALIVASAMFMEQLDGTVITTALPAMARAFHEDPAFLSIALTSYLLSLAVFIPASGQLADRYGARFIFRLAIVIFTFGSFLCTVSPGLGSLVISRIIQGLGGAMMVPVGRLIILRSVEKSERIAAMSWLLVPAMLGPVVGPPLGGLIVTYTSWRWIFAINLPIGVLGFVLVSVFVRDVGERVIRPFDIKGLTLSGIALLCLVGGLEMTTRRGTPLGLTAAVLGVGLLTGYFYMRHAEAHPSPALDLPLMRVRTFYTAVVAGTLFRIGFGALPFLLPLMLQLDFHVSPFQSGMITFATAASSMAMKSVTLHILRRFGYRTTLVYNGLFCAAFLAACAAFRPDWPLAVIYAVLITGGLFRSLQFNAYGSIGYADIEPPRMSAATSFYSTIQQLSSTLGVAVSAAVLALSLGFFGHGTPQLEDFSASFMAVVLISLPAVWICAQLPAGAGSELTAAPAARTAR